MFWPIKKSGLKKTEHSNLAKFRNYKLKLVNCTFLLIVLLLIIEIRIGCAIEINETNGFLRIRRQVYEDPYYSNYYGW